MNLLQLLFPRVRAELLRLLFADPATELHVRDLERQSGLSVKTVQDELAKLLGAKLVRSERDGNRRYYRANAAHPLFPDLQQLVLKTSGRRRASANAQPIPQREPGAPPAHVSASPIQAPTEAKQPQAEPTPPAHSVTLNEID